jgi:hypothetical protein
VGSTGITAASTVNLHRRKLPALKLEPLLRSCGSSWASWVLQIKSKDFWPTTEGYNVKGWGGPPGRDENHAHSLDILVQKLRKKASKGPTELLLPFGRGVKNKSLWAIPGMRQC